MKKTFVTIIVAVFAAAALFTGGCFSAKNVSAENADAEILPSRVEVAETLSWVGSPSCGWSLDGSNVPKKNTDVATGGAIVVNGKTYSTNCIGTHLPAADVSQDIVYDISSYTDSYDMFEVYVAQPDGTSANRPVFSVLVDGVVKDIVSWSKALVKEPAVLRVGISDATTITLRLNWFSSQLGFSYGQCVWLEPTLYKTEGEAVYASDLPFSSTETGWDFGYGAKVMRDMRADGTAISYWNGAVAFGKCLSAQMLDKPYELYAANKNDASDYVSVTFDIENKNFSFFNCAVYIAVGYGAHVDVWIDGEETFTSGRIKSIATYNFEGSWDAWAGQPVNVAIPGGAKTFEIRIIADTYFNDGIVELCDAAFYVETDMLYTRYAEETRAEVFPHALARGDMWNGRKTRLYDDKTDISVDKSLYSLVGTEYLFSIENCSYTSFRSRVGLMAGNTVGKVTFNADVIYSDGRTVTYSSEEISSRNSAQDFFFVYDNEDAVKLKLYLTGSPYDSDAIWAMPKLGNELGVTFVAEGAKTFTVFTGEGGKVSAPAAPERTGYEFICWTDIGGEQFDFDTSITAPVTLYAKWEKASITVTVVVTKDGSETSDVSYDPINHYYDENTLLPEGKPVLGYDFAGWYLNGERVRHIGGYTLTGSAVIEAAYKKKVCKVTFVDGVYERIVEVYYGDTVDIPEEPKKEGYEFVCWKNSGAVGNTYDFDSAVTSDVRLYADYRKTGESGEDISAPVSSSVTASVTEKQPESGCSGGVSLPLAAALLTSVAAVVTVGRRKNEE
ncbi:MAG: InlB B-repeat-containing protein [Clostridia bacterium]|nr:InlB B-repeat-containing protein [Clostridia bacterium]